MCISLPFSVGKVPLESPCTACHTTVWTSISVLAMQPQYTNYVLLFMLVALSELVNFVSAIASCRLLTWTALGASSAHSQSGVGSKVSNFMIAARPLGEPLTENTGEKTVLCKA